MGRERSPNRGKAFELWENSNGTKPIKEIAAELGVTDTQVRKWKSQDKWEEKTKGNITKQPKMNVPKKKDDVTKQIGSTVQAVFTAPETKGLTEKENSFCRFFVINRNATQAAIKAGYSPCSARAIGYENLTKPHIRAEVKRLKEIQARAIMLSENDIVERYMRIAFSDMSDIADWGTKEVEGLDEEGNILLDSKGKVKTLKQNYLDFKPSDQVDGGIISEIKLGKAGMSVKMEDRQKALDWLSNYLGMNPMNKHKVAYDKAVLKIRERELEAKEF